MSLRCPLLWWVPGLEGGAAPLLSLGCPPLGAKAGEALMPSRLLRQEGLALLLLPGEQTQGRRVWRLDQGQEQAGNMPRAATHLAEPKLPP